MLYSIILLTDEYGRFGCGEILMKKYLLLAMTFVMTSPIGLCATEALNTDLGRSVEAHPAEPNIFSIIFSLLFVICLIYVTGLIYTKLNIVGANTVKKQLKDYDLSHVVVLSTTQLGQNKNLHVIELNKKKFLIGATTNSVNLIKELTEGETVEEASSQDDTGVELADAATNSTDALSEILAKNLKATEEFSLHKKYL